MAAIANSANCLKASTFSGNAVRQSSKAVRAAKVSTKVTAYKFDSWMPGSTHPAHLKGTIPGDVGFDPLGLGKDPETLAWFVQAEIIHARFAMLGTAGVLIPEALTKAGVLNVPLWTEAAAAPGLYSFTNFGTLLITQLILMGWVETKRYYDFKSPGSQGASGSSAGWEAGLSGTGEASYPGGAFDPFNFSKDAKFLETAKVKEITNGRLAMLSFAGYIGQTAATGKGPIDNWLDHLADPFNNLVTTNPNAVPFL